MLPFPIELADHLQLKQPTARNFIPLLPFRALKPTQFLLQRRNKIARLSD